MMSQAPLMCFFPAARIICIVLNDGKQS